MTRTDLISFYASFLGAQVEICHSALPGSGLPPDPKKSKKKVPPTPSKIPPHYLDEKHNYEKQTSARVSGSKASM